MVPFLYRRLLPAMLLLAVVGAGVAAADAQGAPQRSSYWRERSSLFATLRHQVDIVMVGDSLTDGAEWAELFPGRSIANRGIDGDTVDGVLARLDDILALRPRLAFVMIGINDFADGRREPEAVFADYRRLVTQLQRAGVQVVVQSTLPCNEAKGQWKSCAALNGKIAALDARLATLASAQVRFLDLRPLLAQDSQLKPEYTYDGIHLNGEGYLRWQRAIAPLMPAPPRRRSERR